MNVIASMEYRKLVDRYIELDKRKSEVNEDDMSVIGFLYEGKTRYLMVTTLDHHIIVQLFLDANNFNQFELESDVDVVKSDSMFRMNFIQIDMRSVDDMFDEEYDGYEKAGINMVGDVPIFRNFKSGYSIWVINDWDVQLIHTAFDMLNQLLAKGDLPAYAYFEEGNDGWQEAKFYVVEEALTNQVEISTSLEKLTHRKRGKWLIGSYYLPFPNMLAENMRPMHSLVCFVVDEDTEEIIHIFEAEDNKNPYISFNEQLYDFMKDSKKRPRSVAFYGEEDDDCFSSLFLHLDVEIENSSQIELLNDVWMGLEEEFLMNLEMAMDEQIEFKTLH